MDFLSKKTHEGEMLVDHRASPGLTPEQAIRLGYHPTQVAEGKVFEAATLTCNHCNRTVIKNPLRVRERAHCFECNRYICDWCDAQRSQPDYVHMPLQKVADLVASGKYELVPGSSPFTLRLKGTQNV